MSCCTVTSDGYAAALRSLPCGPVCLVRAASIFCDNPHNPAANSCNSPLTTRTWLERSYCTCSQRSFPFSLGSRPDTSERLLMLDLKGNRITYFGHSTFSL